jgi:hypothetical protein
MAAARMRAAEMPAAWVRAAMMATARMPPAVKVVASAVPLPSVKEPEAVVGVDVGGWPIKVPKRKTSTERVVIVADGASVQDAAIAGVVVVAARTEGVCTRE